MWLKSFNDKLVSEDQWSKVFFANLAFTLYNLNIYKGSSFSPIFGMYFPAQIVVLSIFGSIQATI